MSSILSPVDAPNTAIESFLTIFFTYLAKVKPYLCLTYIQGIVSYFSMPRVAIVN